MRARTRRIIFVHVPKTGGTSLVAFMERARGHDHTVRLYAGEFGIPFEEFLRWPRRRQRRVTVVTGHFMFGLHELLPGASEYMTMRREPVDRIVSHQLVRALVGAPDDEVPRLNVTELDPLSPTSIRASGQTIEAHNHLDIALYAYARERFAELVGHRMP